MRGSKPNYIYKELQKPTSIWLLRVHTNGGKKTTRAIWTVALGSQSGFVIELNMLSNMSSADLLSPIHTHHHVSCLSFFFSSLY